MVKNRKRHTTRHSGRLLRYVGKLTYGSQDPPGGGLYVTRELIIDFNPYEKMSILR